MVGHGGSSAGSYLADPTSPIPSHCASIVATSTARVKTLFALQIYIRNQLLHLIFYNYLVIASVSQNIPLQYEHRPELWDGALIRARPAEHTYFSHYICMCIKSSLLGQFWAIATNTGEYCTVWLLKGVCKLWDIYVDHEFLLKSIVTTTHCAKKDTIHQVTTMLATCKKSYFQVITTC